MARLDRVLGRSALAGLVLLTAGCAQFQWSGLGPGAPGLRTSGPSRTALAAAAHEDRDHTLPSIEPAPPFPLADRDRIAPIQPIVEEVATHYEMDPDLINGVIWVESRFQPRAKSPAGARGLMQLMPPTASAMARELDRAIARVYEPEFNVEAGSLYLLKLLDRFDGDETLALAAYNAGAGNVSKWMANDGKLPPRSLQYVESVQRARLRFVAMREERTGSSEGRTMLASAPRRSEPRSEEPEVPSPPARTSTRPSPSTTPPPEPTPEPVNPLAPSPDVYRPEPTPEPPLADTPYPPIVERRPSRAESDEDDAPVEAHRPQSLPSVLD